MQGPMGSVLWIGVMVGLMYFLLIRPQKKQQKERNAMLESIKKGDKVVSIGGIHGIIRAIKEDRVTLEIASEVFVHFSKSSIGSIVQSDNKNKKSDLIIEEDNDDFNNDNNDEVQDADYVVEQDNTEE